MEAFLQQPLWLIFFAGCGVLLAAVWCYLWLFHHRFWTTRIPPQPADAGSTTPWPAVLAVVPARNEADVIGQTVRNILGQDYQGAIHLVVVNDNSEDATAAVALAAAQLATESANSPEAPARPGRSFTLIDGQPLPAGWSGKLWALEQGIRAGLQVGDSSANTDALPAAASAEDASDSPLSDDSGSRSPQFLWLTDADISHEPQVLRELVARAQSDNCALTSRMARLCTDSAAERWTIPAFVYFFQLLYPFRAVNNPRARIHGAAGGCILLRRDFLAKIGGITSLKGALIDDCTLAANVARAGGKLHLELTQSSRSMRGYGDAKGVSQMIARTAYTQLHYSPLRLLGTVFGLLFVFWAPLLCAAIALGAATSGGGSFVFNATEPPAAIIPTSGGVSEPAAVAPHVDSNAMCKKAAPALLAIAGTSSVAAFAIMVGTFIPMLRFYRLSLLRALALPLIASFYLWATLKSALHYYQGRSGNWKGRTYQEN